jgi:phage terminase large subunit-like protein
MISQDEVIAGGVVYAMAAVEAGVVRVIIDASVSDTSPAGVGQRADATISIVRANNVVVGLVSNGTVTENIAASATASARIQGVILRGGDILTLEAGTAIVTGGIRYLDVWMGG